jgi:hypothetical protein
VKTLLIFVALGAAVTLLAAFLRGIVRACRDLIMHLWPH